MASLDIFRNDAFSVIQLSEAIRNLPYKPATIGNMGLFTGASVSTLTIAIESINGVLRLVPPTPRGGPGVTKDKQKRNIRAVTIPHFQVDDAIMADEVQGIRAFGMETELQQVATKLADRIQEHQQDLEVTMEYNKLGCIKGIISYADGTTLNLFDLFGITQHPVWNFDLLNASPVEGGLRDMADDIMRALSETLGAVMFDHIHAFCGKEFYKALNRHPDVLKSFQYSFQGQRLLTPNAYKQITIGDITFEEYRGAVGGTQFVEDNACYMFPMGMPGLFKTYYAPADYMETVNTPGREWYAKQWQMENDKGVNYEVQTNQLQICTRPQVLMVGETHS